MAVGESHVVDSTVIPRVHPQVIEAINQATDFHGTGAIGVMEFFSITAAVYGADAAVKAANVTLLDVRLGMGLGGKSFVVMTGDVASVKASVEAGSEEGKNNGLLVSSVVIPSPRPEIFESLM
ncbi:BMC domain-containing protein [Frisingicoccus sp.]